MVRELDDDLESTRTIAAPLFSPGAYRDSSRLPFLEVLLNHIDRFFDVVELLCDVNEGSSSWILERPSSAAGPVGASVLRYLAGVLSLLIIFLGTCRGSGARDCRLFAVGESTSRMVFSC